MKLIHILAQIVFAVDTIAAIIAFMAITSFYGTAPQWKYFALALAFSRLPDLDMIPYLLLQKRFGLRSHWVIGHHPVAFILTVGGYIAVKGFPSGQSYLATLLIVIVMAHFVHDSVQPQGMYWLWPFKWSRLTLARGSPEHPTAEAIAAKKTRQDACGHCACDQIKDRFETISVGQFMFGVSVICIFLAWFHLTAAPST